MPYHLACKSWENTPIKWNSSTTGWWETRLNDFSHYYSARHKIAFLGYHLVNFLCPKNKEYSNKPLNYVRFESYIKQIKRFFLLERQNESWFLKTSFLIQWRIPICDYSFQVVRNCINSKNANKLEHVWFKNASVTSNLLDWSFICKPQGVGT